MATSAELFRLRAAREACERLDAIRAEAAAKEAAKRAGEAAKRSRMRDLVNGKMPTQ